MKFIRPLNEKKPKGAPEFHHSDAPDANGRFKELGIKDLAAWLIKTRKKDVKKISGSLTQQIVFNRNDDPEYAEKMEKVRKEVYKQLGREDLLDKMDESYNDRIIKESIDGLENAKDRLENVYKHLEIEHGQTRRGDKYVQIHYIPVSKPQSQYPEWVKVFYDNDKDLKKIGKELGMDLKESVINEEDSYDDYPAAAKKNAQMAIDWKEKYGRDEVPAGTPVGWARAHQLANGEKISADTVKRMAAFNRHRKNSSIAPEHKDEPWKDNGYVAWLIWGGDEGVDWAIEKSKEIDAMKESKQFKHITKLNEFKVSENREADIAADIIQDLLDEYDPWELSDMLPDDAEATVSGYGYKGAKAKKIADHLLSMATSGQFESNESINESGTKFKKGDKIEYKQLFGMGSKQDWVTLTGVVMKVKNKKKSPLGMPAPHQELTLQGGAVVSPYKNHKDIKLVESNQLNEGYWSHYEYDKWTKENGKPKYPKWVKVTLKEIIKGGFMDPVYDNEHMYIVLWLASIENQRRAELYAYDKKGTKEFGKVGYKMIQRFWNDLTSYTMFSMQGALYALEVSKHVLDMVANQEPVEPAYYLMKEYFNNFGMDTKRSRIFNAAYEKLDKWMKDNQIQTL